MIRTTSLLSELVFQAGVPALGIDPHPENVLARRVYEKIGLVENGVVESEWGTVVAMSLACQCAILKNPKHPAALDPLL